MESAKKRNGSVIAVCILLVLTLIANILCFAFNGIISQYFNRPNINRSEVADATQKGHDVAQRVSEEGIVLLKNESAALPLNMESETKVNAFGLASMDPFYTPESSAQGNKLDAVNVPDGLANAGITINPDLYQFYYDSEYKNESSTVFGKFDIDYAKKQVPVSEYPQDLLDGTKTYSDVALIFISRYGAEGFEDLPLSMEGYGGEEGELYLELSQEEKDMLEMIHSMDFEKNIVILNTGNPMECGFLDEDWIDSALWIGYGGQDGMNALGRILSGAVNPSGRLTDTYAYDSTSSPAFVHFGDYKYTNVMTPDAWAMTGEITPYGFMEYSEGIYVGYRYYETRYVDNATGEMDENAYREAVQYPFGYGLSYSTFQQDLLDVTEADGVVTVKVRVTNTGDCAGKDVVQVYFTPPYTEGGIEKAFVNLAAFGKTALLDPGASEEITLTFALEDMASYDDRNARCYVLEKGDYEIKLMANAHDLIDSGTISVAEDIVYNADNKRDSDLAAAENLFDDVRGEQEFLSRADWEGTWPERGEETKEAPAEVVTALENPDIYEDQSAEDIVFASNGLKLKDLVGVDYNDERWTRLLEQLSVEDMQNLIGFGGYQTIGLKSVGKPYTVDLNGPGGIFSLINDTVYESVGYPISVLVASTWNQELIEEMGDIFGAEANAWKVSGLYSPSLNLHRTPYNGRAAEYYSEDPLLSGKCAAAYIRGVQSHGVYTYAKHMGLYEQCVNTEIMCNWISEQALREIYLKAFEIAVKEGHTHGIMVCYNKIGPIWTGACEPLLGGVLRGEWGFDGMVISDGFFDTTNSNMNQDMGIRGGADLMLSTLGTIPENSGPVARQKMREAAHHVLYTVANSNAMEIGEYGPSNTWKYCLAGIDVLVVLLAAWAILRKKGTAKQ